MNTMKKYTAVLAGVMVMIAASWAWADVAISPENFPDEVFGQYLLQFDADGDGVLSVAEIEAIDGIDVQGMGIKSLEGIGYLTAIKELNCRDNSIETLDLHGLTELEIMRCGNSSVQSLDLSGCAALKEIHCQENGMTFLGITGCNALEYLNARDNALTGTIDLHGMATLRRVNVRLNQLASLDVHGCAALTELYGGTTSFGSSTSPGATLWRFSNAVLRHHQGLTTPTT